MGASEDPGEVVGLRPTFHVVPLPPALFLTQVIKSFSERKGRHLRFTCLCALRSVNQVHSSLRDVLWSTKTLPLLSRKAHCHNASDEYPG